MAKGIKTGGRKLGTPNKACRDLREVAQQYTPVAIQTLAHICERGESEAARVAAANGLLDRGHGKPTTVLVGDLTQRRGEPRFTETISETAAWIESVLHGHKSSPAIE